MFGSSSEQRGSLFLLGVAKELKCSSASVAGPYIFIFSTFSKFLCGPKIWYMEGQVGVGVMEVK